MSEPNLKQLYDRIASLEYAVKLLIEEIKNIKIKKHEN